MFQRVVIVLGLAGLVSANALAETKVIKSEYMQFDTCLKYIRNVATELKVAPQNIVETDILRMVRISTNDGSGISFLITCSKPDNKLVVNQTQD